VALNEIKAVGFVEELLVTVSEPLRSPSRVAIGLNCTLRVAVWVGFSVRGKVAPETENPVPLTLAAVTVTGAVPVEDRIIDWVAGEFTRTSPKEMLVALMLNVATPAPS
jgi:hypothetical protein